MMTIELLYFDGCPSYEAFLPRVDALLRESGLDERIELRRVESDQAAQANRFLGSPTLRIDGTDVDPDAAGRTDFGLKCRLYQTAAGLSPTPPDEWVLAALKARTDHRSDRRAP
jgi:hypothetical protein